MSLIKPEEADAIRADLINRLHLVIAVLQSGCLSGGCDMSRPTGMVTNGGCRCWQGVARNTLDIAAIADDPRLRGGRGKCYGPATGESA